MNEYADISPQARTELREQVRYYADRSLSAASRFLAEFEELAVHYGKFPSTGRVAIKHFRYFQMRRFPFYVFYSGLNKRILIVGLCHTGRHPDVWKSMLKNL